MVLISLGVHTYTWICKKVNTEIKLFKDQINYQLIFDQWQSSDVNSGGDAFSAIVVKTRSANWDS